MQHLRSHEPKIVRARPEHLRHIAALVRDRVSDRPHQLKKTARATAEPTRSKDETALTFKQKLLIGTSVALWAGAFVIGQISTWVMAKLEIGVVMGYLGVVLLVWGAGGYIEDRMRHRERNKNHNDK